VPLVVKGNLLLHHNQLRSVYHPDHGLRTLKELVRSYLTIPQDLSRVMSRVKAIYRSWAIACTGKQVYAARHRGEWLAKINEPRVRRLSGVLLPAARYAALPAPGGTAGSAGGKQEAPGLETALRDPLERSDPGGGAAGHSTDPAPVPHQAAAMDSSGVGIETSSSADHQVVNGQLERKKKQIEIRGLNRNYNHDLKNLFQGAAIVAATKPGPFAEFYAELLAKGMRPEMARLTLARKIVTTVLIVWKRGVRFDAQHLKPQTA
jgi:hypothetical protein